MTPGRLFYLFWHKPLAEIARCRREGGPINQGLDSKGRRAMMAAAKQLPAFNAGPSAHHEIWFLTGQRYWYQTAFCFRSLQLTAAQTPLRPVFVDDGSFNQELCNECLRVFPDARLVTQSEIATRLDQSLPFSKFPTLRKQRLTYFHLRKLTDIHAGLNGWRLVLDSDMLFFRQPDALLGWLQNPSIPVNMADIKDAYGYPLETLHALAGANVPSRLNVGVCGLRSDQIDWERLEYWCAQLIAKHGTSYYLEQALVALMLSGSDRICLDSHDYQVMPNEAECRQPTAALHHYVDLSKRGYFRHAWKHFRKNIV